MKHSWGQTTCQVIKILQYFKDWNNVFSEHSESKLEIITTTPWDIHKYVEIKQHSVKASTGKRRNYSNNWKIDINQHNTGCSDLQDMVKAVFRGKFIAINVYIKNEWRKIWNQWLHTLGNLKKKSKLNPKLEEARK